MPNIHDARDTYRNSLAFLVSRDEIPFALNSRGLLGCGVEIGVQRGIYSEHLLQYWEGQHLISVDPWMTDEAEAYVDIANVTQDHHNVLHEETKDRLLKFAERSSIWRMTSLEAARKIPRSCLDFVYVDARHDYDSVLEDLDAWVDRLRPGAIFAGHDYIDGHFPAGVFKVRTAVDEFFAALDIPVHATIDDGPFVSWIAAMPEKAGLVPGVQFAEPAASELPETLPPMRATTNRGDMNIDLKVDISGRRHEIRFLLDPEQMSQKMMIDGLQSNNLYEPETSLFFILALKEGDGYIDVGTHVGYFSMLAASLVGSSGSVVSFEPEQSNFRKLTEHIAINRFAHVESVNAAVSDKPGKGKLFFNRDNDGGHALWNVGEHSFNERSRITPEEREIDLISIDEHFRDREVQALKLIKIDAEGCELQVLRGAKRTIERSAVPFIVLEINSFALAKMGANDLEIRQFMEELGYETLYFAPGTMQLTPLRLDQHIESNSVYNLVFRHPEAPALDQAA